MTERFVIAGTDTGVGKTILAAALASALGAAYWKPIQSGLDGESDSEAVCRLGGLSPERIVPEAWRLTTPASPHRAAEIDGVAITPERLQPPVDKGRLVIEGAGGVLVPITRCVTFADVFARWHLPVVLVARTTLGTINHSLLSIEALRCRDVPLHGIAFVGPPAADSEHTIAEMGGVRRLGRLPVLDPLTPATLAAAFATHFDATNFL
ncbi:dethiobiotin synthase [Chelatococcus sp. SYSU_G07232]|uniref:ATP-dependent dethiobiotin synthetase BioD n=1 Tax=Chelatococcus albus TaxID=3047466 RepID=A0ABT7AC96_9HYPH|nr:dethiobiotin synthase [Chelatococcus sp. SYSU_G07232]MDJ1156989.1 dethiobiotin synthase [Chelatococcus sp. SYSU_G07232]